MNKYKFKVGDLCKFKSSPSHDKFGFVLIIKSDKPWNVTQCYYVKNFRLQHIFLALESDLELVVRA